MEIVLTAKIKLLPNEKEKLELKQTIDIIKKALNYTSEVAYNNNLLSGFKKLQTLVYYDLRQKFGLKSQMSCNVCSVVAGNYASMKSNGEKTKAFYKKAKLQYSYNRDYSFVTSKKGEKLLSVGTLMKRIKIPYETNGMEHFLDGTWEFGTGTLVYKKGKFYLHISCKKEIEEVKLDNLKNIVGADFGMNFLVTAIDNHQEMFFAKGRYIKNKKAQYVRTRKKLQTKGTKSAKRCLAKISGRENRFQTDVNHCVSKALVNFAGKDSLIALEDLTGINLNTWVQKKDRYYRSSWAFAQLRQFIEYKAKLKGSKVVDVDPAYTSQKCPKCGHTERDNRNKKTHIFICKCCGYTSNDDRVAAMNIRQSGIEYRHNQNLLSPV